MNGSTTTARPSYNYIRPVLALYAMACISCNLIRQEMPGPTSLALAAHRHKLFMAIPNGASSSTIYEFGLLDRKTRIYAELDCRIEDMVVNSENEKLYWTCYDSFSGTIQVSNVDEGECRVLSIPDIGYARGIGVDARTGAVWWTECSDARIRSLGLSGNVVGQLFNWKPTNPDIDVQLNCPVGITIDEIGEMVCWRDNIDYIACGGFDGSGIIKLANRLSFAGNLAFDSSDGRLFWGDGRSIYNVSSKGGDAQRILTLSGPSIIFSVALDIEQKKLYFADAVKGLVYRIELDGSELEEVLVLGDGWIMPLAAVIAVMLTILAGFGYFIWRLQKRRNCT